MTQLVGILPVFRHRCWRRAWPPSRSRWYPASPSGSARTLALIMGILQGLQGLGTGLAILMVYLLFDRYGLQVTFWVPGIAGGIILLTLTRWFYNEPADRGITQWGAPSRRAGAPPAEQRRRQAAHSHVFLKEVQKTFAFWNLATIHGLGVRRAQHHPDPAGCHRHRRRHFRWHGGDDLPEPSPWSAP